MIKRVARSLRTINCRCCRCCCFRCLVGILVSFLLPFNIRLHHHHYDCLVLAYSTNSIVKVPHHLRPHHTILRQLGGTITTTTSNGAGRDNPSPATRNSKNNCIIFIDLENVRGKSGFELSHQQVLEKTSQWARYFALEDQVVVVVDHGEPSAYYLSTKHISVAFSGNHAKADDVIAQGVASSIEWTEAQSKQSQTSTDLNVKQKAATKIVVVTADHELQSRCRRGSKVESLHIIDPQAFLDDLEWMNGQKWRQFEMGISTNGYSGTRIDNDLYTKEQQALSVTEQVQMGKLDTEIRLRGQLLDVEMQLDRKRTGNYMTKKRRKKMEAKLVALRRKLALRGPSLLDQLTNGARENDINKLESDASDLDSESDSSRISREEHNLLLARWRQIQNNAPRREQTGDRIIYAEGLRRELEEDDDAQVLISQGIEEEVTWSSAKAFVRHINRGVLRDRERERQRDIDGSLVHIHANHLRVDEHCDRKPPEFSTEQELSFQDNVHVDTLDLVVISDTHGFEGQFNHVQTGDVLLHLGDFALEGSIEAEQRGLEAFDRWLAKQPHEYKIVIRGNHDPFLFDFPVSKAMYVTKPTSINIGGFEMALVPHGSPRRLAASGGIPPTCDLIASHLPPYKTLDKTYTGKSAGSNFLCNIVRGMPLGPPPLWLVGHIHEGRGMARRQFGRHKDQETLVINASNANAGRATHLTHGPVALRLDKDNPNVQILAMDDMSTINQPTVHKEFFHRENGKENVKDDDDNGNHLLLAVDLGLKSGVSLFNSNGQLLRYEQFLFDRATLKYEVRAMMKQWRDEAGEDWKVTHVAIEGGDTALLDMWDRALSPHLSMLRVRPEEWRAELLTAKENQNGDSAKAASRLIARQIVEDFGIMESHRGKFPTDVAESVLLGAHVARRLGWIEREPAVRRYTNGNIVVPKKSLYCR